MKVILAGFNIDLETLTEFKNFINQIVELLDTEYFSQLSATDQKRLLEKIHQETLLLSQRDNLTPETLSAAYARISRNPKPIQELREIARKEVEKARKSNQNIIFGLGHSSVAEHAVFNFDILGISRFAVEFLEHFRLASFTEKSQRYILFQDDYVIPEEITHPELRKKYRQMIQLQNQTYHRLYEKLRPLFFEKYAELAKDPKKHSTIEGYAKEDARYVISLATETQLGMTVNARSLENIIVKAAAHPLQEVKTLSQKLHDSVKPLTPSIVKYTEPGPYLEHLNTTLPSFIRNNFSPNSENQSHTDAEVILVDFSVDSEEKILSSLLFHHLKIPFSESQKIIRTSNQKTRMEIFKKLFHKIQPWDSVPREFEMIHFTFELIVSASNFAQLKRHRMATLIPQEYHPALGVTIPPSFLEAGVADTFMEVIQQTNQLFETLANDNEHIAPYILTNSHRRRVLFRINGRELYHFSRLRQDEHAQWDIRQTANKMVSIVRENFPNLSLLLCGKDKFEETYAQLFKNQ